MSSVDFYFDFSCPWSYLALLRLRDVADRNAADISFRPVSVHQLLATENPGLQATRLSANPAKAAWQKEDLGQWARFWGITLDLQPDWPFDASAAAAAMIAACKVNRGLDFALRTFAEHFGAGADITDPAVLGRIATAVGMDPEELSEQMASKGPGDEVAQNTLELIRRGGFGTPTTFVGDRLFFGNDRIPLVEWMLGPISDDEFVMPGQHGKV